ncbi:hemerythrin domain-containing protein [Roseateles sp.]|uniref:hemerythrin domain-containing protein n=1 Tax=Roseateles sp. TaxID=1971397 RepID=UPI0025ED72BB|nr:hemerythrin domain-containing protein [Roseateles sp.]MBV8036350.1 hemerythrin domain-containing protein [Roseateles sp.]
MNTPNRHDLYAPIHKALRLFMTDTLAVMGRLDLDDPQELAAGLARLDALLDAAAQHLRHENEFVHPALDAHRPGTSATIAAEHREHLDAIAALRAEAATLRALPTAAAAHRLYRQLAAFVAENFEHMDVEETRHNQVLWAAYGDVELQAIEGRIHAHVGPQEMSVWLRWLIPALNPAERAALIGSLPPEAQAPVLDSARALLDDMAWSKLCRALGRAPVSGLVAA